MKKIFLCIVLGLAMAATPTLTSCSDSGTKSKSKDKKEKQEDGPDNPKPNPKPITNPLPDHKPTAAPDSQNTAALSPELKQLGDEYISNLRQFGQAYEAQDDERGIKATEQLLAIIYEIENLNMTSQEDALLGNYIGTKIENDQKLTFYYTIFTQGLNQSFGDFEDDDVYGDYEDFEDLYVH